MAIVIKRRGQPHPQLYVLDMLDSQVNTRYELHCNVDCYVAVDMYVTNMIMEFFFTDYLWYIEFVNDLLEPHIMHTLTENGWKVFGVNVMQNE